MYSRKRKQIHKREEWSGKINIQSKKKSIPIIHSFITGASEHEKARNMALRNRRKLISQLESYLTKAGLCGREINFLHNIQSALLPSTHMRTTFHHF